MKEVEETRLASDLIKDISKLMESDSVDAPTFNLTADVINTFGHILELLDFALQRGWNADDLIRLANVISALRQKQR